MYVLNWGIFTSEECLYETLGFQLILRTAAIYLENHEPVLFSSDDQVISLGYVVTMLICIPMGYINLVSKTQWK